MSEATSTPRHIAVIMDGNGRWARERGKPRSAGHRAGAEAVREVIEGCREMGVEYLTLYAFSSENWNRPADEVKALMDLLARFLDEREKEMHRQHVRLLTIGEIERLPKKTQIKLDRLRESTKNHKDLTLVLALSYGSREEIVKAARKLAVDVVERRIDVNMIDQAAFESHLETAGIPDPDLLIRTSGEMRISNFLLWQISYAEIVILRKNWPDFCKDDLREAIVEYHRRQRRFGALPTDGTGMDE